MSINNLEPSSEPSPQRLTRAWVVVFQFDDQLICFAGEVDERVQVVFLNQDFHGFTLSLSILLAAESPPVSNPRQPN
ncbi:hypothetical protein [Alicyclobacillus acidocaldarius]|uniref:hypothetical protein n=1 Tax=Alicyclobacillus acidocaldarius TaxID=405212 RepID=UPI001C54F52C|nr:hypothetical protein [Alicyclobacillus acidocaldarius]